MKVILTFVFLFVSMQSFSQKLKDISYYFLKRSIQKDISQFRIGKSLLEWSGSDLYLNKKLFISQPADSFYFLEVYDKKFIVVSYYPNSVAHRATGPQFRPKRRVDFISLMNNQKWVFDLEAKYNSAHIIGFEHNEGKLTLRRPDQNVGIVSYGTRILH